jgi:hypothetical protein
MMIIKTQTPGLFFGEYTNVQILIASPQNIARFSSTPSLPLQSSGSFDSVNQQQISTSLHYYDGKEQYQLNILQVLKRIVANPHGKHMIYHNSKWVHAKNLEPYATYISNVPTKISPTPNKKTPKTKKSKTQPPQQQSQSKSTPKPKPKPKPKPTSKVIIPSKDPQLLPLHIALTRTMHELNDLDSPHTISAVLQLKKLDREWKDGIDVMQSSQPLLDQVRKKLRRIPKSLLVNLQNELNTIEQMKDDVINQPFKRTTHTKASKKTTGSSSTNTVQIASQLYNELINAKNGWMLLIPSEHLELDNEEWNKSRIGTTAKLIRQYDKRVSFSVFLEWCNAQKAEMMLIPLVMKKKEQLAFVQQLKSNEQFNEINFDSFLIGPNGEKEVV